MNLKRITLINHYSIKHNSAKENTIQVLSQTMERVINTNQIIIQGLDPGIVTTASVSCFSLKNLFHSINRCQLLQLEERDILLHTFGEGDLYGYTYNASTVNNE